LQLDLTYRWEVAFYSDIDGAHSPTIDRGQIQQIAAPVALVTAKSSLETAQILSGSGI
jgi:hypothetical protein